MVVFDDFTKRRKLSFSTKYFNKKLCLQVQHNFIILWPFLYLFLIFQQTLFRRWLFTVYCTLPDPVIRGRGGPTDIYQINDAFGPQTNRLAGHSLNVSSYRHIIEFDVYNFLVSKKDANFGLKPALVLCDEKLNF